MHDIAFASVEMTYTWGGIYMKCHFCHLLPFDKLGYNGPHIKMTTSAVPFVIVHWSSAKFQGGCREKHLTICSGVMQMLPGA